MRKIIIIIMGIILTSLLLSACELNYRYVTDCRECNVGEFCNEEKTDMGHDVLACREYGTATLPMEMLMSMEYKTQYLELPEGDLFCLTPEDYEEMCIPPPLGD